MNCVRRKKKRKKTCFLKGLKHRANCDFLALLELLAAFSEMLKAVVGFVLTSKILDVKNISDNHCFDERIVGKLKREMLEKSFKIAYTKF